MAVEIRHTASPAGSPVESGAQPSADTSSGCRSPHATFADCPLCGGALHAEHAHFRCGSCGWRDSCCD